MLKGIDHVVIVVADLDRAIASFEALGFTVVRGGRHTGLGTHNALIAFADGAYFELIAFRVPASTHRWFAAVSNGGGLTDFCMQTGDLDADAAIFKRAGTAVSEPFAMERERPDGYMLKWVLAVAEPPSAGAVPFLIRDITPRDERVPRARAHRNGAAGIRTLTVAVEDAAAPRAFYERVLGARGEVCRREDLGAAGVRFVVAPDAAQHELQFVAPVSETGVAAEWLRVHGPSPCEVTLRGPAAAPSLLDTARAQNARILL
jgi:catechol 2,3-dioxygenase-like lactoylglutathione lyase family enzyme